MDKRSEPRVEHHIQFFVHVHECVEDPDLVGVSVACDAIDFSTRGLQFKTDEPIPSASVVKITIGIGEPFAMYQLLGEVRWVRDFEDEYAMGILLSDADTTDYDRWATDFQGIFG